LSCQPTTALVIEIPLTSNFLVIGIYFFQILDINILQQKLSFHVFIFSYIVTFLYDILEKLVFESHAGAAKGGRESKTGMAFTKDRVVNFFADRIEHSDIAITVFSDPVCLQCGTARIKGIVYFLEITWFYDIIRIEGGVPQIISREVFDAVQAIMDKRKMEPYIRSDAKEVYLLSGKVFCGLCGNSYCGNRMHGGRNKSLYITYRCNSHSGKGTGNCRNKDVNRDYLENYIRKLLAEVLFDERRLEGVISEYNKMVNSNGSEYDSELRSVRSMIKKTKGEIDNLIGILAATGSASLAEAVSEREERLAMLKEKRREIESRRVTIETNREDIAEAFERGREMLLSGTIPHLRQLIQLYVSRIDVYPDHISATLNYLPALRAVGSDEAVGNYGAAAQNALEVREDIGREELNLECK